MKPVEFCVDHKDSWDHKKALKDALLERELLLKERPELQTLQNEIDRNLASSDNFEEKMKILGKMIGNSLNDLHDNCSQLADICNKLGIETKIPILELKKKSLQLTNLKPEK